MKKEMEKLKAAFPRGIDYKIIYDTTIFIDESIHEVYKTLFEAFCPGVHCGIAVPARLALRSCP